MLFKTLQLQHDIVVMTWGVPAAAPIKLTLYTEYIGYSVNIDIMN